MDLKLLKQCWFLAGPTAVGKTELSFVLAERLNAEILSLDSMAIYRGMDVGTAKPSIDDQKRVPHHLIDLVEPFREFSVAEYTEAATTAAEEVVARNRVPLFVGGTGLYLRSLLRGIFDGPESDPAIRAELNQAVEERGQNWLHAELKQVDPVTAERLHPNDVRRVIRAIEVFRLSGQPLSGQQKQQPLALEFRPVAVWLEPDRSWLHRRINQRVDNMMAAGLLQEVGRLLQEEPPMGRTARQALGYRELIAHLRGGNRLDEAVQQIRIGTRQFAKRQHTWFRNLEECESIRREGADSAELLADRIMAVADRRDRG